jgi:CBS domain-containing protein
MNSIESILNEKGRSVFSIPAEATVLEAAGIMCAAHVGALIVMRGESIVGMFSERDLMKRIILSRLDAAVVHVGDVMTCRVVCTTDDVSTVEAMAIMTRECVRHLPVLRQRRVDGIVSMGDLVRWTIRDREHAVEQLTEYVGGTYPG